MTNKPPSDRDPGVLVLLPVLNERQNIAELLDRIDLALGRIPYTVCVLDDGSKDGTAEYVEARMKQSAGTLHLIRRTKTGRGSQRGSALHVSLLWGLEHTRHEIFVEMDGDLSHRPEELPEGIGKIQRDGCDVAIASKYLPGSLVTNRPWGRLMVSKICGVAVRALISTKVRDYSNGYRFYTRQAASTIAAHQIRYTSPIYLTEVLALWLREGLKIGEFPSTYIGRNEGLSKLRIIDLVKAALAIFEVSVRHHITGFGVRNQAGSGQEPMSAAASAGSAGAAKTREWEG